MNKESACVGQVVEIRIRLGQTSCRGIFLASIKSGHSVLDLLPLTTFESHLRMYLIHNSPTRETRFGGQVGKLEIKARRSATNLFITHRVYRICSRRADCVVTDGNQSNNQSKYSAGQKKQRVNRDTVSKTFQPFQ
jgi:hypothetical protein